jgi:hypothetical protein
MNGAIEMGYSIAIIGEDLKCKKDINEELEKLDKENELFLPWYWREGHIKTDMTCFKWAEDFIKDLEIMKDLGVRGYLITRGEEDDCYKYVITSKTLKEYYGRIVFPGKSGRVIKRDPDLKKYKG